ncbi:unnamed protein product [Angiostrongylus costaricensis]|uniref:RING-type domain-containing protein n=1 Tax=Angiostrongylus costaricensis TaxID=334426 RepID=A0A0R3PQI4_ANGCS|nr:unnamed protein product [Angiostrongylus costaricensis]
METPDSFSAWETLVEDESPVEHRSPPPRNTSQPLWSGKPLEYRKHIVKLWTLLVLPLSFLFLCKLPTKLLKSVFADIFHTIGASVSWLITYFQGYLIDATTVIDCLHTFCKSCLLTYFEEEDNCCPSCEQLIHQSHPSHYVAFDRTMQDIVYKLFPLIPISRYLAHSLWSNMSRYNELDLFCNDELMGRDFSMRFIHLTRCRNKLKDEPLKLVYRYHIDF